MNATQHILIGFSAATTLTYTTVHPLGSMLFLIIWQTVAVGVTMKFAYFSLLSGAILGVTLINLLGRNKGYRQSYYESVGWTILSTFVTNAVLRHFGQERYFPLYNCLLDAVYFFDDHRFWLYKYAQFTVMFAMSGLINNRNNDSMVLLAMSPVVTAAIVWMQTQAKSKLTKQKQK